MILNCRARSTDLETTVGGASSMLHRWFAKINILASKLSREQLSSNMVLPVF
jgi:hypothetical protein